MSTATWDDVRLVLPYVTVSCVVLFLHRRQLDLLRVGDDEAVTLGVPVTRVRLIVVVAATLGTAAVVAVSGLIGFVGLVVPHMVRLIAGASYRRLMPLTIAFGAAFLILADIPGRTLDRPGRTADRRRDGVRRRAVLHRAAAHPEICSMSSIEFRDLAVRYGRRTVVHGVLRHGAIGGVAGADRAERGRQVVAAARRSSASSRRAATCSSTARR